MADDEAAEDQAPVVDGHAHVFTRAMPFAADAHSRPDYDYPVETGSPTWPATACAKA
jgi:predicted TIM-barrel fold metal-dependent hydrolase